MTGTAVQAPRFTKNDASTAAGAAGSTAPRRRPWYRSTLAACVALLLIYVAASFALNDQRGTLGTDTGGKLATLRTMQRNGSLVPDVGYWAERWDPQGDLQPLYYTYRIGNHWVNVTTLPMLDAAYPLYLVGGERAALLLPMLGAVFCAAAAAALARRLHGGDGAAVFWIVGLATPLAIYALDFWEHSVGLACMLWAVVLLHDVWERRAGWRAAACAGALFGLAATMRTEALVYIVVAVGVTTAVIAYRERSWRRPLTVGTVAGLSAFGVLVANRLLEQLTFGTDLRGARVSSTAAGTGTSLANRVHEALTTAVGMGFSGLRPSTEWLIGCIVVASAGAGAWLMDRGDRRHVMAGGVLFAVAGFLYLDRFTQGVGFVPGLFIASPFAIVGLVWSWRTPTLRIVATIAIVPLPLVWLAQYQGGADPQWGGRYILLSSALLTIAGVVLLAGDRRVLVGVVLLSVAVTLFGIAWLSVRSHTVADGARTILTRHDEMLISRQPHFLREAGAFYDPDRRWLTATDGSELRRAVRIAQETGVTEFGLIGGSDQPAPARLGPFVRGRRELVPFIRPDVDVSVVTYRTG